MIVKNGKICYNVILNIGDFGYIIIFGYLYC